MKRFLSILATLLAITCALFLTTVEPVKKAEAADYLGGTIVVLTLPPVCSVLWVPPPGTNLDPMWFQIPPEQYDMVDQLMYIPGATFDIQDHDDDGDLRDSGDNIQVNLP